MAIRFLSFIITLFFLVSCQTTNRFAIKRAPLTPEQEQSKKKIMEWKEYMGLLENGDISTGAVETVLRLSDEYFAAEEILYGRAMEDFEQRWLYYKEGKIIQEPEQPVRNYAAPIKYFRKIIDKYRYGPGADAIRYILAYSLYEDGKWNDAAAIYESLLNDFPESSYAMETSFRLAEFYFETGQSGEAIEHYKKILNRSDSTFYDQSLYKLGWTFYKAEEFRNSVDTFMLLLDKNWEGKLKKGGLMEETISSMTMALNHFKGMDHIIRYLQAKGIRDYTPLVIKMLAERIFDEGRYSAAISVYKGFIRLFPDAASIPFIYEKISGIYDMIDDEENSVKTKEEMVRLFNPQSVRYREIFPTGSKEVDKLVHDSSISVAKIYHAKGKDSRNIRPLLTAIKKYKEFLSYFPESSENKKITLLLADAYFDAKMYTEAALRYEMSAELYPEGPEKSDIIYSALLTYEILFRKTKDNKDKIVSKIDQLLFKYSNSMLDETKTLKIKERMADMYAELGNYAKARSTLVMIAEAAGSERIYIKTAELYLKEGDFESAEKIYAKIVHDYKDPVIRKRLSNLRLAIANKHFKEGKYAIAAKRLEQAYLISPDSELGEAALVKLGELYIKTGDSDNILSTARRIAGKFPGSERPVSLLVEGGRSIEKADPLKAAMFYETASAITNKEKYGKALILAASILFEENRRYDKTEELLLKYLNSNSLDPAEEADALLRLASSLLHNGKNEAAYQTLRRILKKQTQLDADILAETRLMLMQEDMDKYLSIKLAQPFEKTLHKKTVMLEALLNEATEIIQYKIPDQLSEVFFKMGLILENFKDSLIQSERPADLTGEDLEDYDFLLEEKAYPYEEQSLKAYEQSVTFGREYRSYNKWLMKSLEMLSNMRPALYRRNPGELRPVFIQPEAVSLDMKQ